MENKSFYKEFKIEDNKISKINRKLYDSIDEIYDDSKLTEKDKKEKEVEIDSIANKNNLNLYEKYNLILKILYSDVWFTNSKILYIFDRDEDNIILEYNNSSKVVIKTIAKECIEKIKFIILENSDMLLKLKGDSFVGLYTDDNYYSLKLPKGIQAFDGYINIYDVCINGKYNYFTGKNLSKIDKSEYEEGCKELVFMELMDKIDVILKDNEIKYNLKFY